MNIAYVELGMHNLETTGQAKDGGKKNFKLRGTKCTGERSRRPRYLKSWVKKNDCKVKANRVKKSCGASRIST
jgi:hypothetical protein